MSEEYTDAIKNNGMTYELVTPDMHRHNAAEKAIQMFKDLLVVILSGGNDTCPNAPVG